MDPQRGLTAILPCNDLNASEEFYRQLGFARVDGSSDYDATYRILSDGKGGHLHLVDAVEGWLVAGRNPFGLYLYTPDVDELALRLDGRILEAKKRPEDKPWGMYEFSVSDPDETLVRIGWPTRLRNSPPSASEERER
jgi:catechol 2,3-dioxygenase-like lactoylglutathione lyase family enzyme